MNTSNISIPDYDQIVERNDIDVLKIPADLSVLDGDLALTRRGDLMLNSADYSAFYRLVNWWRYNHPVMAVMFNAVFPSDNRAEKLSREREELFASADRNLLHPMLRFDYGAYHRINDAIDAEEVAREVYAGAIVMAMSNALQSFREDIQATMAEWNSSSPIFESYSFGQAIVASANNARHADEWQTARPPNARQLQSMRVLAAVLNEPLDPSDGSCHPFGKEISPEILRALTDADITRLETAFFAFAKDLLNHKRRRTNA